MDFPAHKKIGAIPAPVNMRKQRSVEMETRVAFPCCRRCVRRVQSAHGEPVL